MPTATRDNPNQGRVYDIRGIAPTITDVSGGGGRQPMIVTGNKIRKLTPLECWRLMGFSDADFKKAQSGNSNTQLYKQAGNSIVKNVLVAVFGQMLPGKENIYKDGCGGGKSQLLKTVAILAKNHYTDNPRIWRG